MKTNIQKWGNSLAVRIPKSAAEEAKIEDGATVDVSVRNGKVVISTVQKKKYHLHGLLAAVTKENVHQEMDTGPSAGREVW